MLWSIQLPPFRENKNKFTLFVYANKRAHCNWRGPSTAKRCLFYEA